MQSLSLSFGVVLLVALPAPKAAAAPCDAPVVNEIACENTKPGNPSSEWQISGSGSSSIQGFATDISVNRGSTIGFKIKTTSTNYRLDIYRMGYYGGMGARKVATVNPTAFPTQPACQTQSSTGLIDCGNWTQTASWAVPSTAVSGIYFAHVVTTSGSAESHIVFIVRNDASTSDLFFQTSDTTWQAYNDYGGNSLYEGSPAGRAYKVSYNRPFDTNAETPEDFVWNAEYPMVRFLEANGYDVSYTTGVDTERRGNLITNHKTFLSVGHDEYWSGGQRANVEAARSAGVNLAFFSGNEVFWKTRWENSISTGNASYRTLVTYKETHANAKIDPNVRLDWYVARSAVQPSGRRRKAGKRPHRHDLHGQLLHHRHGGRRSRRPDAVLAQHPRRKPEQRAVDHAGLGILGYEWDESPDNGFQPAGLIRLSTTTRNGVDYLQDYGSTYAPGSATHHLTMYRAPSGALVFGAGTVQWAWGLDNNHSGGSASTSDDAVRQATVNLFADMGVQPATLQSGLSAATASSDTTAPTSTISLAGRRRDRSGRPAADRQRHSDRRRRRQGRRGRGLNRQRHLVASSHRPRLLVLHLHPRQQWDPDDPYACHRRQPPHGDTFGRPHYHRRNRNAATTRQLPMHHLAEHRDPGRRLGSRLRARSRLASSSVPARPGSSAESGSTRDPATPEPTLVRCGRPAARSSARRHSLASPAPDGSR